MTRLLWNGPKDSDVVFLFAHGAGAHMDSDWMNVIAEILGLSGIGVARFEFPYMQERRTTGKKRPPNPQPMLIQAWKEAIASIGPRDHIYIGGKSMGGRIASLIADETHCDGLVCFGFPFHPPGKSFGDRVHHLQTLKTRTLILQGERDPMGSRIEIEALTLSPSIRIHWLTDGDHSLAPRKSSPVTFEENLHEACAIAAEFML